MLDLLGQAEIVAHEIIDSILNEGAEDLYSKYISEKSKPFSIHSTTDILLVITELHFLRHEVVKNINWLEVSEPKCCAIDNWARSAIPLQKRYVIPEPEPLLTQPESKSFKSHKSGRSSLSALTRRQNLTKKDKLVEENPIEEAPQPFPIPINKILITEEEEQLRIKKENEFKRKFDEAERARKLKEELEEKEKRLKKEAAEMRKKLFTYDTSGNIIFISQLKYDTIPKLISEVDYKHIENKHGDNLPPNTAAVGKRAPHVEEVNRLKTAPMREQEWVRNMTSVQPSIFDTIKLNPGVTLAEGIRVKYPYTMNSASQKTLTRKDYLNITNPSKVPASSNISMDKKSNVSSMESFLKNSKLGSRRDILEEIPDYEDVVALIEESEEIKRQVPKTERGNGKITFFGPGFEYTEETSLNKFNAEILKNKNWGINPTMKKPYAPDKLPKRPSSRELREIYGNISKKPKDKPFITSRELWKIHGSKMKKPKDRPYVEKVDKKTKPPPPPYGLTMINALPDYEEFRLPK
ncbi:hypothetical protein SteCoe_26572 [Stentor coeruleus]|uniref:Uncharacterized protein n=1 Tax=Stentor coeruleus TaxID=5963 RepID=A0A1R2BCJ9_9CILI|nr:hypothetical protein SteCoe_26572 [Stentor coeruleus]